MTVSRSSMLPSRTLTDCSVIRGDQSDGVEAVESVPAEVSDLEGRVNPLFFGRIQAAAHADGELSVSSSLRQRGRDSFSFESFVEQTGWPRDSLDRLDPSPVSIRRFRSDFGRDAPVAGISEVSGPARRASRGTHCHPRWRQPRQSASSPSGRSHLTRRSLQAAQLRLLAALGSGGALPVGGAALEPLLTMWGRADGDTAADGVSGDSRGATRPDIVESSTGISIAAGGSWSRHVGEAKHSTMEPDS